LATHQVTGIVLAGGKSSRMQTDKGFISYKGKLLVEHALDQLLHVCDEIIISANRNEYTQFGYPVVKDSIYDLGPLGGIYSAVQSSTNDLNLILACDVIIFNPSILTEMISTATGKRLVYLENTSKGIEPLPLLLNKNILPEIETQINNGDFKLQNFILGIKNNNSSATGCIQIYEHILNLNTMEDLKL